MLKGLYNVVSQMENINNNLCFLSKSDALSEEERATICQLQSKLHMTQLGCMERISITGK